MSNNISNFRQIDMFNYAQHPLPNTIGQIACRLCNRVFPSNQALIAHIESHMAQEDYAIRRLYSPHHFNSQRELISNQFRPNFPRPMMLQETRNFPNSRLFQAPPQQPMVMPQPRRNPYHHASRVAASQPVRPLQLPPPIMPSAKNNVAEIAQVPTSQIQQRDMEVSAIDGTKSYINLLDKPIKNIEVVDLVNNDDDNSDLQALNLALKL